MTREEAVRVLKEIPNCHIREYEYDSRSTLGSKVSALLRISEAIDMAIEALKADVARWSSWNKTFEQSGITDLISRADAMSKCKNAENELTDEAERKGLRVARFIIGELPSADIPIPQDLTTEQWDKYIEECRLLRETLSADRPSGEWIRHEDYGGFDYWECSNCKEDFYFEVEPPKGYNYCPSCGAIMENTK